MLFAKIYAKKKIYISFPVTFDLRPKICTPAVTCVQSDISTKFEVSMAPRWTDGRTDRQTGGVHATLNAASKGGPGRRACEYK